MKKLSIITICYNEPDVRNTCESIVNQSWQDFEWIVIDGGSNKDTLEVFEEYKQRINKFVSEPDNGIYDACNKGIRLAEGEFVQFLNAGDSYYDSDVLMKVFAGKEYDADVLYGEQYEVYKDNPHKSGVTKSPDVIDKNYLINSCLNTPAVFIKRKLFETFGMFNEEYKIVSDYEKFIVFFLNGVKFQHLDEVVAAFDKNGISSSTASQSLHIKERDEVLNKYFTQEEIKAAYAQTKLSFLEQIFSVKTTINRRHIILTFMGIHLKIRIKRRVHV